MSDADSFAYTRRLAREEALLVGGSSGMAAFAAKQLAEELAGTPEGERAVIVVLLPDSGRGYLTKVFNDDWLASYGFAVAGAERIEQTVGEVLRGKSGRLPDLVHTHPSETIAEAVHILQEYSVSQMPVVRAEPPIVAAEVAGSVSERGLLDALFTGAARLTDRVEDHMSPPLPVIGSTEPAQAAVSLLESADAVLVQEDGKPVGVLTRQDLLAFLSADPLSWGTWPSRVGADGRATATMLARLDGPSARTQPWRRVARCSMPSTRRVPGRAQEALASTACTGRPGKRAADVDGQGLGTGQVVAAGGHDHDLGVRGVDLVPGDPAGLLAGAAEDGVAAGEGDHLGDPVPGREGRIGPLEQHHPRTGTTRDPAGDGVEAGPLVGDQRRRRGSCPVARPSTRIDSSTSARCAGRW